MPHNKYSSCPPPVNPKPIRPRRWPARGSRVNTLPKKKKNKVIKMKWFKEKIAKWVEEGNSTRYDQEKCEVATVMADNMHFKDPLNITIFNATGGKIVKFSTYNERNGESNETTYLVHADENFEESLSKFIALEAIKHV